MRDFKGNDAYVTTIKLEGANVRAVKCHVQTYPTIYKSSPLPHWQSYVFEAAHSPAQCS